MDIVLTPIRSMIPLINFPAHTVVYEMRLH